MADDNKTEPGTPRKREKARDEGQVLRGHDLPGAAAILSAVAMLAWFGGGGLGQWRQLWTALLEQATDPGTQIGLAQLRQTFLLALGWTGIVVAAAWLCCTALSFQGGFVIAAPALLKWERLRPDQNVKKIFSASGLSRAARSTLPVAVICYFTYGLLSSSWGTLVRSGDMPVPLALDWLLGLLFGLAWRAAAVLLAWSGVDYLLQRRSHEQSLKMTKQEVKDESKETQGNPETRGRIRKIQRQMARRRMMREVPFATVVITNPTEYAIALKYEPGVMAAPVVVAKGRKQVAARIRALAVGAGVPIVENRPLARALYRYVEIGSPIPGKLYAAVAEILAFLHRARARQTAMAPLPDTSHFAAW